MLKTIISFTDERRGLLLRFAVIIVLAYVVFANSFSNEWTMDDVPVIVNNPDILSVQNFFANTHPERPLREITFMLDHALFGLNPSGYHIQQIFWHSLNALLIFALAHRLSGDKAVAWISSLLFLVHPVQVEAVANISHRKESLVLAFGLLSVLTYIKYFERNRKKVYWVAAAFGSAFIAYLAKETAVALPFVFIAYELVYIKREERLLLRYPLLVLLFVSISIVVLFVWLDYIGGIENIKQKMHLSLILRANHFTHSEFATWYPMILKSWGFMMLKLFLPINLAVEYTYPVPESWLDPWVISTIVLIVLYIIGTYMSFSRQPVIFFTLVWFAAFFLPISNLIPLSYFAADRYLYAPSAGFFILVALLMKQFLSPFRKTISMTVLILVITFSALTWRQNKVWRSTFTLYSHAVTVSPRSAFALCNLGWQYYLRDDAKQAIHLLKKAADVNPYVPTTFYNLASIYEQAGYRYLAVYYYSKSLRVSGYMPGFFDIQAESIRTKLRGKYGIAVK